MTCEWRSFPGPDVAEPALRLRSRICAVPGTAVPGGELVRMEHRRTAMAAQQDDPLGAGGTACEQRGTSSQPGV